MATKKKTTVIGLFTHKKGAPFSDELNEMLENHSSINIINGHVKYMKGDEVTHHFTIEDIQFVEPFITFNKKHKSCSLGLFVNGKPVNMDLLK